MVEIAAERKTVNNHIIVTHDLKQERLETKPKLNKHKKQNT